MKNVKEKYCLLISLFICAVAVMIFIPAIPQSEAYHNFADKRTFFCVNNCWDVLSNIPFVLVGIAGLVFTIKKMLQNDDRAAYFPYAIFFAGVLLTGFGSAYYHLNPTTQTLVWDRLPMTISFMAFFAAIISERISEKIGRGLLIPLLFIGAGSILYWIWTEGMGCGDLRIYALVQFIPITFIPIIILLFPSKYTRGNDLFYVVGFYGLSKLFEAMDNQIYMLGGIVSGHTLKHLAAAVAVYRLLRMLKNRKSYSMGDMENVGGMGK